MTGASALEGEEAEEEVEEVGEEEETEDDEGDESGFFVFISKTVELSPRSSMIRST